MQRKDWIPLLIVFVPLLVGALASFAAQWLWNPVPVLVFKIDVGMVIFVAGVFITMLLGAGYLSGLARERQARHLIEQSLGESEQGRQRFIRRLITRSRIR